MGVAFEFWILDFGFWILDFGFWILNFEFSRALPFLRGVTNSSA
jgi:hypothetical protein